MTMMIVIIMIIHTSPIVQTIIILIDVITTISIIPMIIHITQWYELKINWIVN